MPVMARSVATPSGLSIGGSSGSIAAWILLAAAFCCVPLTVVAVLDASGLRILWDNLHWSVSSVGATAAAAWSVRGTEGRVRSVRTAITVALLLWTAATLTWAWLSLIGATSVPSASDVFLLAVAVPGLGTVVAAVRGRLTRAEETAVYLDATLCFLLIGSLLAYVAGPAALHVPTAAGIAALLYPTAYIGLAGAGLVATLAVGYPISRRGPLPLIAGSAIVGIAYLGWIAPSINLLDPGELSSISFTIGTLLVGWGAVTWDDAVSGRARYRAIASEATRIIAPTVASILFLLVLFPTDPSVVGLIHVGIFAASIVFIVRQGLLLQERTSTLARVTALTAENARLVDGLRAELDRRVQDQRRIIQASRAAAVGELAAGVAHEVNNPLTGVLGFSELLLADLDAEDPHRPDVETIRDEALRARRIVRALRDFAAPSEPQLAPTDLSDLVHRTVELARYSIERRGVEFHEDLPALTPMLIDGHAIQQALLNVLTNAAQAVGEHGRIDVAVRCDGPDLAITVTDDGVGMDAATLGLAFEPFFSGRSDEPGLSPARGLGLSVSNGLVESHGGTIRIDSSPGGGTTVEIRLPSSAADGSSEPEGKDP